MKTFKMEKEGLNGVENGKEEQRNVCQEGKLMLRSFERKQGNLLI